MTCRIIALVAELQLLIIENLHGLGEDSQKACINLSSTCSLYRSILAPDIFNTITLRNDEKSAELALEASKNHICQHVKHLELKASLFATRPIFAKSVRNILSNLHMFPKLDTLGIQFLDNFGKDEYNLLGMLMNEDDDDFYDEEDLEDVMRFENERPWRRLMRQTYQALYQNKQHGIKTLILRNTIPKIVSACLDPE
jgi:hypothetical protein